MTTIPITTSTPDITDENTTNAQTHTDKATAAEKLTDAIWGDTTDTTDTTNEEGQTYIKWISEDGWEETMLTDANGKPTRFFALLTAAIAIPVAVASGLAGWGLHALIKH